MVTFTIYFSRWWLQAKFTVNGQKKAFCAKIAFFSGDNLGSQQVSGFKEDSGASLKCRQCMGDSETIKKLVSHYVAPYVMCAVPITYLCKHIYMCG